MKLRVVWVCALSVGVGLASGCKGKKGAQTKTAAGADLGAVATEGAALDSEEKQLLEARAALQKEREGLVEGRERIDATKKEIEAAGGKADPALLAKLAEDQAKQLELEREHYERTSEVNDKLSVISAKKSQLVTQVTTAAAPGGVDPEAMVRGREVAVKEREAKIAEREAAVAKREKEALEACKVGGTTTVVMTAPPVDPPKGVKYSKSDVEKTYKQALRALSSKGILDGDLPTGAADLKDDTRKSMEDGDYTKAKYQAEQLLAVATALKVDRAFLTAKFARLSQKMKGKTLSSEGKSLFETATSDFGDGKFSSANSKLNKLFGMLK